MNYERVAENLINLRNGRSREEVAKAVGISISTLQMYENGQRIPRDNIKIKLANFYGVTVQIIFF
ncbi:helix-turn-helix transcriptional regulator [Bacillus cereus]|uniref:helix-turn-helix transcriptional regulator n=2 Tax=Bacillaceae TaxID=186817 RepID=UPI00211D5C72|nr:helix-turn-helix transcriptional regulator [Bacillus cereus]